MDYSKLSDFEINKLVAESFFQHASSISKVEPVYPVAIKGNEVIEQAYRNFNPERFNKNAVEVCFVDLCYIKDYCNNPSDAWPIIFGNDICTEKKSKNTDFWVAATWEQISGCEYRPIHQCSDKNPLRAAMIVYLMMQDELKGE